MKKQIVTVLCTTLLVTSLATPVLADEKTPTLNRNMHNVNQINGNIFSDQEIIIDTEIWLKEIQNEVNIKHNTHSLIVNNEHNIQPTGKAKYALKAVKKYILDKWDSIPILHKAQGVRGALMEALDKYFEYSDDVEEAIYKALKEVLPNTPEKVLRKVAWGINLAVFP